MSARLSQLQKNLLMLALEYRGLCDSYDLCLGDAVHRIYGFQPKEGNRSYVDPEHPTRYKQDHHWKGQYRGTQFTQASAAAKVAISRSIGRLEKAGLVTFGRQYGSCDLTDKGLSEAYRLMKSQKGTSSTSSNEPLINPQNGGNINRDDERLIKAPICANVNRDERLTDSASPSTLTAEGRIIEGTAERLIETQNGISVNREGRS